MAVPKRKTSVSKKKMRRSHHRVTSPNVIEDKKVVNINFLIMLILNLDIITVKNLRHLIKIND